MKQKIKMLILKIVFSPIWLVVALAYCFAKGFWLAFNRWDKEDDRDIFEYWRL